MPEIQADTKQQFPFLRWTGSKRWLTKDLLKDFLPKSFENYHEPFLGGGAVFFHLKSISTNPDRKYFLSDTNNELINCYHKLQEDASLVIDHLKSFINTEEHYYQVRLSRPEDSFIQAARFIYLNRTSFNGIYRVNSEGKYNVPYGKRINVDVITEDLLKDVSKFIQGCDFSTSSFEKSIDKISKNDLVFIDPPYTVAHENNGFIEYNQTLFSWDDQLKLKAYIEKIAEKGAYFILTNASHHSLTDLYDGVGKLVKVGRLSKVGGRNKTRGTFNELIVFNT
ncbi:Dam family site-specific DNA-(adenine-N6)-methyltransferase [Pedobacter sp. V48]|uniref:DNA adenine methylase n=1 Tax=Pedobacter sp. V48 TaxID=509635 RepID=UPI0003E52270|nr:Dam family site-specific DNA-(adenine-N6)-methyltransferase [Pedobacter sp. V48]ETZ22814.1 hypothetical protein N824_21220 [Pedobacter sp. V48]